MSVDLLTFIDKRSDPNKLYSCIQKFIENDGIEYFEAIIQNYTGDKFHLIE